VSVPSIVWMREKYFLKGNPFPAGAILSEGSKEPSESGEIFDPEVNPEEFREYIQKFVVQPALTKAGGFGALWSLGVGQGEARGYGKSSLGFYVSGKINEDFGESLLKSYIPEGIMDKTPIMASYASFKKDVLTGFHAVGFRHAEWLTEPKHGMYDRPPTERLRELLLKKCGSEQEAREHVEKTRSSVYGSKLGPMNDGFLDELISGNTSSIRQYLDGISTWNRMRNGFIYLDTVLTFAMAAGIQKAILFTDQVEDFASKGVPRDKRLREVERFRDIVMETAPFNSIVHFILTMHPRAREAIWDIWADARLPNVDPPGMWGGSPQTAVRVQVLKGIQKIDQAIKLFKNYLNYPGYRLPGSPDPLHPLSKEAIGYITKKNQGRPGFMLVDAHDILELAAMDNLDTVDLKAVQRSPSKVPAEEAEAQPVEKPEGLPKELQ